MKPVLAIIGKILRSAIILGMLSLIIPRLLTGLNAMNRLYTAEEVPVRPVAIVFGAGLWWNGQPTPILRDRVTTAARLYQAGKVAWLLMSGSHTGSYNEPQAMREYAINLGIPEQAIVIDDAGNRTYDTCYRALHSYNIRAAALVTQRYHQPRALYTCNQLGIDAVGVASDLRDYQRSSLAYWHLRELPATLSALIEIHLLQPKPAVNFSETSPSISPID